MRSFCLLLLSLLPSLLAAAEPPARPSIILLMGDDHGWDEVGYNGHPYLKTPVLDEMARAGLRLDRFYSGGASCSPTRATVMTAPPPPLRHVAPGSPSAEEIGVARLLRTAGYSTAHFGKWHLGPVQGRLAHQPGAMGFDPWLSHDNFFELNPSLLPRWRHAARCSKARASEILVRRSHHATSTPRAAPENPSSSSIWFGSPHEPYQALPADLALYDDLPATFARTSQVKLTSNETGRTVTASNATFSANATPRSPPWTAPSANVAASTSTRARRPRDNTLLWYCGDNGTSDEAVARRHRIRGLEGTVYEGGTPRAGRHRVARAHPAVRAPPSVDAVTSDLLPTLCALAGQPLPSTPTRRRLARQAARRHHGRPPNPICFWEQPHRRHPGAKPYLEPELQQARPRS